MRRSWNEFWGSLLLLRCHERNPLRWTKREERAEWLYRTLSLGPGCRILDLGCGDGILDICLARLGAKVTGIDRIGSVLEAARTEITSEKVNFIVGDLRDATYPSGSFDVVLMLELVGLMSKENDARLISNASEWLAEGGKIVIDCPSDPEDIEGQSQQELDDGTLQFQWTFDPTSRFQHIIPEFRMKTGEVIELYDPYDPLKLDHLGVLRYLYPMTELRCILEGNRFEVQESEQHWRDGFYVLIGTRGAQNATVQQGG